MRIDNQRLIESEVVSVNPYNLEEFEIIADEYGFSDLVKEDVRKCIEKFSSGQADPTDAINVCIPKEHETMNSRSQTITRDTYTGYGNREYYQEMIHFKENSETFAVRMPKNVTLWEYVQYGFTAGARTGTGILLDNATYNMWSLLNILFDRPVDETTLSTVRAGRHSAALIEDKYRKYTWVCEGNEKFIGSIFDYSFYKFNNYLHNPGVSIKDEGCTELMESVLDGYREADKIAYKNYQYSGYDGTISTYLYENLDAGITTEVDSLLP